MPLSMKNCSAMFGLSDSIVSISFWAHCGGFNTEHITTVLCGLRKSTMIELGSRYRSRNNLREGKMHEARYCSHCREVNWTDSRTWPYCHVCGHRCDLPRRECDCNRCTHMRANLTRGASG